MIGTALMPEGSYSSYFMEYGKLKPSTRRQNQFLRAVHPFYPDGVRVDRRTLANGQNRSLLLTLVFNRREYPRGVRFLTAEMIRDRKSIPPLLRGLSLPRERKMPAGRAGKHVLLISSLFAFCLFAVLPGLFRYAGRAGADSEQAARNARAISTEGPARVSTDGVVSESESGTHFTGIEATDSGVRCDPFSALFNSGVSAVAERKGFIRELSFSDRGKALMKLRYSTENAAEAFSGFAEDGSGATMESGEIRRNGNTTEALVELSFADAAPVQKAANSIPAKASPVPTAASANFQPVNIEKLARAPGRELVSFRTANGKTSFFLCMRIEEKALPVFITEFETACRDSGTRVESFGIRTGLPDDAFFLVDAELKTETETSLQRVPLLPVEIIGKAFSREKKKKPIAKIESGAKNAETEQGSTLIGNIEEEDGSVWIFTRMEDGKVSERLVPRDKAATR